MQFVRPEYQANELTMSEPVRNKFLTARDKAVFDASGYGARGGFGNRPALLGRRSATETAPRSQREPSAYFRYKRLIDFIVALLAIVIFSPVFLVVSVLVLFDLGAPVVFWQKRIGRNGKSFLVYKCENHSMGSNDESAISIPRISKPFVAFSCETSPFHSRGSKREER